MLRTMRGSAIGSPVYSPSTAALTARPRELMRPGMQATATAFAVLFCIVGLALWGLPYYYDFMLQQFGWTRAQVTSGNALSRLVIGPLFGFAAGWLVDRFGPRRLMLVGILMAAIALVGLGSVSSLSMFYFFYIFNALGYVCGGPLPNQVLLTRWFDRSRGKAMGIAYLGIGLGGAVVPWLSHYLVEHSGWQSALRLLGVIVFVIPFPLALFVKEPQFGASPRRNQRKWSFVRRLYQPLLLLTNFRQHVFHRGGQRNAAKPEAFPHARRSLCPSPRREHPLSSAVLQHGGTPAHGLAGRSPA